MTQPRTKISQLRELMANEDWRAALRMAAKFDRLGEQRNAIKAAHECLSGNARFYQQLGRDTDALVADGIAALKERYNA